MTNETPEEVKPWTAKRRQAPDYHDQTLGQSLDESFRWPANKGALHEDLYVCTRIQSL